MICENRRFKETIIIGGGKTMKMTEQELAKRNMALENSIASHLLEGLEPDVQTIEDLKCVVRGEFGIEESLRRVKERISLGQFRKK
jgi:hypothetical protein